MLDHNKYVEAPNPVPYQMIKDKDLTTMFMAGGISGTEDWQKYAAERILKTGHELFLINPRRDSGLEKTGPEAKVQIKWEYDQLGETDTILFWFPHQTVCPIALFELGSFLKKEQVKNYLMKLTCGEEYCSKRQVIYIGCDENYSRKFDLETQVALYDPSIEIQYTLDGLCDQITKSQSEYLTAKYNPEGK